MEAKYEKIIKEDIAPIVQSGRAILFLGAGYSCGTDTVSGNTMPIGSELVKRILNETGHSEDPNQVDLQSAFSLGEDEISDFYGFLCKNFMCKAPKDWQKIPFYHWWRRIYTTNIDNVIDKCISAVKSTSKSGPHFQIYNYKDRAPSISNPLEPPVVYLHGKIDDPDNGFIFDGVSYADHSVRSGDWLHDAAFHISSGHCIVLGSKLKESDLETELRKRTIWEKGRNNKLSLYPNWIVLDKFNSVEISGYEKRGLIPIVATSQEFLECLSRHVTIMSEAKLLKRLAPHLHIEIASTRALAWFSQAFSHVPTLISKSLKSQGIYSRFYTGDSPDWFYIANCIQADFDYKQDLMQEINTFFASKNRGYVYSIAITGPIASGKTTLCRSLLHEISQTMEAVYEFTSFDGIDIEATWTAIKNVKGAIVFFIDKASEHFYAINELSRRFLNEKNDAKILYLIEERDINYQKNKHHLFSIPDANKNCIKIPALSELNAEKLVESMTKVGLSSDKLPANIKDASKVICDIEKGYRGDLLATLCDITGNKTFKEQLNDEYRDIPSDNARNIFKVLTIITAARLSLPIQYLSEINFLGIYAINHLLATELDGKVYIHDSGLISSRHHVIAEYHLMNMLTYEEKEQLIIDIMKCVSSKYCIKEIKLHPLPYRIYKGILHHSFLRELVFPTDSKRIENVYSKCQSMFVDDGIFWLQYGRYLYLENRSEEAEHCFRKGLAIYDSFQIRHALGHVLLKIYLEKKCTDKNVFNEGLDLLITEIVTRGKTDPYPFNTLCQCLIDILDVNYDDNICRILREYSNQGIRFHREDIRFQHVIQRGIAKGYLGLSIP